MRLWKGSGSIVTQLVVAVLRVWCGGFKAKNLLEKIHICGNVSMYLSFDDLFWILFGKCWVKRPNCLSMHFWSLFFKELPFITKTKKAAKTSKESKKKVVKFPGVNWSSKKIPLCTAVWLMTLTVLYILGDN